MAYKKEDLVGKRYGKLTIIDLVQSKTEKRRNALCRCECGKTKEVTISNLRSGATTSCGCLREKRRLQATTTHGMTGTKLHNAWRSMKARCNIESCSNYSSYGGRGINVCDEWNDSYEIFEEWALASGYADNLTLDRINTNGDYEPSNCRWVDKTIQARNRRVRKTNNTGVTGVSKRKDSGKYRATISVNGKRIDLGTHENLEDAINARKKAENKYW
jgi:hypothetical protein